MDVEKDVPLGFTDTGVVPVGKTLKAQNSTMGSCATLTADPVEVLPRPELAREFAARFRATSCATETLEEALAGLRMVVPATGWEDCVPLTAPPEVLT